MQERAGWVLWHSRGQGQGHPLAVGRPLQQRVVGSGAAPLLIGAGLAYQPDQLGEHILLDARLGQQTVRLPQEGVAPALQGLAGLVVGEQHLHDPPLSPSPGTW